MKTKHFQFQTMKSQKYVFFVDRNVERPALASGLCNREKRDIKFISLKQLKLIVNTTFYCKQKFNYVLYSYNSSFSFTFNRAAALQIQNLPPVCWVCQGTSSRVFRQDHDNNVLFYSLRHGKEGFFHRLTRILLFIEAQHGDMKMYKNQKR